jgi:capsular exopolysaccharide synthesis family protein
MSRLFDALQRSGAEQSGVQYPDVVSMVSEVFEAKPVATTHEPQIPEPVQPAEVELLSQFAAKETVTQPPVDTALEFPSLNVSVAPESRLVFFTEPDSLAAEKFRFLGVRLRQMQQGRTLKKVLITSTIPEEGKSLVSANLAGVLARRKQRVLLIEGDLRRPTLAQRFGLGRLAGIGEWLQGDRETITNIYRLSDFDFWMMPAGDPPVNPLELMHSGRLARLMESLADRFDWIIVDSPPLLPLADTTVWSRVTDGTLLVARVGITEKAQLQRGLELVKKSNLVGVVLNGSEVTDYKSYYQRYSPYGSKQGSTSPSGTSA